MMTLQVVQHDRREQCRARAETAYLSKICKNGPLNRVASAARVRRICSAARVDGTIMEAANRNEKLCFTSFAV
jgi:hypothetical protein